MAAKLISCDIRLSTASGRSSPSPIASLRESATGSGVAAYEDRRFTLEGQERANTSAGFAFDLQLVHFCYPEEDTKSQFIVDPVFRPDSLFQNPQQRHKGNESLHESATWDVVLGVSRPASHRSRFEIRSNKKGAISPTDPTLMAA